MSSMHAKAGEKLVIVVVGKESGNLANTCGGGDGGVVKAQELAMAAIKSQMAVLKRQSKGEDEGRATPPL